MQEFCPDILWTNSFSLSHFLLLLKALVFLLPLAKMSLFSEQDFV
jgi:hypothetical protein